MLSAIIATHDSEHALVRTLAALVPGATEGLLAEVIVADAGSTDDTGEVADVAGCRFMVSDEPLGARLKSAAASARAPWLMFLRAGCVPSPGWVDVAREFMNGADDRAAVFRPDASGLLARLRATFGGPRPEQGLVISRSLYDALGGHVGGDDAERALLRAIGWRRIVTVPVSARYLT